MIVQILEENQDVVDRIKTGEDKLVGFLVGLVMKQSNGSVNPGMAKELLLKKDSINNSTKSKLNNSKNISAQIQENIKKR